MLENLSILRDSKKECEKLSENCECSPTNQVMLFHQNLWKVLIPKQFKLINFHSNVLLSRKVLLQKSFVFLNKSKWQFSLKILNTSRYKW